MLRSRVIPLLRVAWFRESRINVSFLCQGQVYTLKVKECGVFTGDDVGRLSRRHVINILSEFSNCSVSVLYAIMLFRLYN